MVDLTLLLLWAAWFELICNHTHALRLASKIAWVSGSFY